MKRLLLTNIKYSDDIKIVITKSGVILRQLTVDTGWAQNSALVPPGGGLWILRCCLYPASGKTQVFHLFVSLHHTNNSLENISVFLCHSTQLPKKKNYS